MLYTILIGLATGILARFLKPGADTMGWIMTCLIGIGGSWLAGYIGGKLGHPPRTGLMRLAVSVAGAVILLLAYDFFLRR